MNKSLFDTNLKSLENFILNSAPDISYSNFIIAILVSAFLAFIVKLAYIRISRTLNDREYFSDIFVPLAIITTLVITVIKFSLASVRKSPIGSCDPVNMTGFAKCSNIKLNADAV